MHLGKWKSRVTALTVEVIKFDDGVVWWEDHAHWSFPQQTIRAVFEAVMEPVGRAGSPNPPPQRTSP